MVPPLLFLLLGGIFAGLRGLGTFEPPLLLPILNTVFGSALPLVIAGLALRSYASRGSPLFVLLGCGMVAFSVGNVLAGWGLTGRGPNFAVTVHNASALAAGAFQLAAVVILFTGSVSRAVPASPRAVTYGAAAYAGVAVLVAVIAASSGRGLLPPFFAADGPTLLRQVVLAFAVTAYIAGAALVLGVYARTGMAFLGLYCNALLLTGIGLAVFLVQTRTGGPLGWTGRASQYAGCVYFVVAVVVGQRETRARGSSLPAYLSELFRENIEGRVKARISELQDLNRRLLHEVDERRRAEMRLRRSEERLRLAAEATGFGVYAYDHEYAQLYTSTETLALFGLPPDGEVELGGDLVPTATHPDDVPLLRTALAAAFDPAGEGVMDVEFRIRRTNGQETWLRARGRTSFRGGGGAQGPVHTIGILQDITRRKVAEAKLRESEEVYRSILQSSLQGIAVIQDGRLVLCNDALCRISGYPREEMLTMTAEQVQATIHPSDRPRVVARMRAIVEGEGSPAAEVLRLFKRDGGVSWAEVLATRTSYHGRPALQISYVDVTARKQAEDAYRALVENAPEGYAIVQSGRIVFANRALAALTGYPLEELLRLDVQGLAALVDPGDRAPLLRSMEERLAGGNPPGVLKFRFRHQDGSSRIAETQSVRIDLDGAPAIQVLYRDVTEAEAARKALEETHRKMRNLASHLLRAREEERRKVAQEVHDELGQILTALKMDLHWLHERVRGSSETVDRKMRGMIQLGEQTIGAVQRIASELRPRMLDDLGLAPALDWLAADFQRRVRVSCSVSVDVPDGLVGGSAATVLYRVVQEALSNVGRHARARTARVDLRAVDGSIQLRVEDDGIGITAAQRTAADSFGLIGMHERIEDLGGTVLVTGEPGGGTTVTARIPLPQRGGLA